MDIYQCPKCGYEVLIVNDPNIHYKYKIVCKGCSYIVYSDNLENLKELKERKIDG